MHADLTGGYNILAGIAAIAREQRKKSNK